MIRNGEKATLTQHQMDAIATYMDDDIREDLHFKPAPCDPELFLSEYVKKVPDFAELLKSEFGIELED